jgi:glycosyltransferase involved in cell wall biosynthesis
MRTLTCTEPTVDGVFRHVEQLVRYQIRETNNQVDLAYSSKRTSKRLLALIQEVTVNGGHVLDLAVCNAPSASDFNAYRKLYRFVEKNNYTAIHAHSSKAGALCRLLPAKLCRNIIYTPHAYFGMGRKAGPKELIFNSIEKLLASRATTIALSPEEADFAMHTISVKSNQLELIPNAVDFELFRPTTTRAERTTIRQRFGITNEDIVIGSIGRLGYQKNHKLLYQAFYQFKKQVPDTEKVRLLHIGTGSPEESASLQELIFELGLNTSVIRPEYRCDPEVFYQAMDAFCLSSRYEGLPFTGLEALASNLPLILTDAPGLRSFGSEHYGFNKVFYCETENVESLANAMHQWYQNRDKAVNHRDNAKDYFSIPKVYGKILELYRREVTK